VGFDLASDPTRLAALNKARDTGLPAATARITLVQERSKQYGFLVFLPVYLQGAPTDTVDQRRKNLIGFALGVFRIGDMVAKSLTYLSPAKIDVLLQDESSPPEERFLHAQSADLAANPGLPEGEPKTTDTHDLEVTRRLNIADRQWSISLSPTSEYLSERASWQSWAILFGGILFSCVLLGYHLLTVHKAILSERLAVELSTEVDERKKPERELLQAQKMEAVGRMAGGLAHEFNNILAAISTESDSALELDSIDYTRESLKNIIEAADAGSIITRNLLNFAKPSDPVRAAIDLHEVIEKALAFLSQEMTNRKIRLEKQFGRLPSVVVDAQQIQQVFVNLLSNASDAMSKGGALTISTRHLNGRVQVAFADTGVGIAENDLRKVFDPFFTTKGAYGGSDIPGTGLGMSVALGIIRAHGGDLSIESKDKRGTRVTVSLPVGESRA